MMLRQFLKQIQSSVADIEIIWTGVECLLRLSVSPAGIYYLYYHRLAKRYTVPGFGAASRTYARACLPIGF